MGQKTLGKHPSEFFLSHVEEACLVAGVKKEAEILKWLQYGGFFFVLFLFSIRAIYSISCQFIHTVVVMGFSWFSAFRTSSHPTIPFKFAAARKMILLMPPFRRRPCRGTPRGHLFSLNITQLHTGAHTHSDGFHLKFLT